MKLPDIYSYSLQSEPKKKCLKSLQSGLESCGEAVENRFGDTFTEQALKVVVVEEEKKSSFIAKFSTFTNSGMEMHRHL